MAWIIRRFLFLISAAAGAGGCQEPLFESALLKAPEGGALLTKEFCSPERIDYFRLRSIYGDQAVYLLSRGGGGGGGDPHFIKMHDQKAAAFNRLLESGGGPRRLNRPLRDLVRFMEAEKVKLPQTEGPNRLQNWILDQIGGGYRHFDFSADVCVYLRRGFEFSEQGEALARRHSLLAAERDRLAGLKKAGVPPWRETKNLLRSIEPQKERLALVVEDLIRLREGFWRDPAGHFQSRTGQEAPRGLEGGAYDGGFCCTKGCLYEKPAADYCSK